MMGMRRHCGGYTLSLISKPIFYQKLTFLAPQLTPFSCITASCSVCVYDPCVTNGMMPQKHRTTEVIKGLEEQDDLHIKPPPKQCGTLMPKDLSI